MQNKFFFNAVKCFLYSGLFILTALISNLFTGCSGSEEEATVDQRTVDSIEVYAGLQKSFTMYKKALSYNEAANDEKAAEYFESSLKYLNEINSELINKPGYYFWRQDYSELAKAIVEDYLTTQGEISQSSLVFDFAKRYSIVYEKIEGKVLGDREPLPDGSEIPLIRNSAVEEYIEFFSKTDRGRSFIDKCIYRSGKYFPIMRKILKFNNAPEELIYLSVQESGLAPTIVSRAGAVGLWQFMYATGYAYGLNQDEYRDDRRDFEKSTDAAARHLKDLYRTFDDWYLAFCAYNAGPGRVNSAIRKSGSRDFWSLRGYLPGETRNYVPSILALSFVLRNPEEYGFNDVEYGNPLSYDRVNVNAPLTLQNVASFCETDIETIRDLNPEITNDILPSYSVSYQLRIPEGSFKKFSANYEKSNDIDKSSNHDPEFAGNEIGGYGSSISLSSYRVANYEPSDVRKIAAKDNRKKVSHEYKSDMPLQAIAIFYEVRPVEIRMWNNISYGEVLNSNRKLDIYISEEKYNSLYGYKSDNKIENDLTTNKTNEINNTAKEIVTEKTDETSKPVITEQPKTLEDLYEPETKTEVTQPEVNKPVEEVSVPKNEESTEYEEEQPEEVTHTIETTKKVKSENVNSASSTYIVREGDYLSVIAGRYGVTLSDLMEWNNLYDDKILVGQRLRVKSGTIKAALHTVSEGENLSMIAKEYGMSVTQIKQLNDLDDDKIMAGQKLKVSGSVSKDKSIVKTNLKKTYKVRKGETLASIAAANEISIENLKSWNNIKNDKIIVGQILKLYQDKTVKKIRRKKN